MQSPLLNITFCASIKETKGSLISLFIYADEDKPALFPDQPAYQFQSFPVRLYLLLSCIHFPTSEVVPDFLPVPASTGVKL